MKQYLNFNRNNISNYSLQHSFLQIFKKIELVFLIMLSLIFIASSRANKNFKNDISFLFVDISLPIIQIAALPFNATINLLINFQELIDAKKQNQILQKENDELRAFYLSAINLNNENQELKNLLKFVIPRSTNYVVAKILGRTNGAFTQNLFLNAGKNRDLKEGAMVTGSVGMIGRIGMIEEKKSQLILVTDPASHIPIIASKARARGILVGNNNNLMEVLYLSKNHHIEVGDMIFTSGDGDTLPPGILVGVVRKVSGSNVGVEMVEDINNADIVTVMQY